MKLKYLLAFLLTWLIVAGIILALHRRGHVTTFIDTPIPTTSEQMQTPRPMRTWKCHQLVSCPRSDWRATRPEDVCTYVDDIENAIYDPAMWAQSYGAHCEEIDPKG